jgi:flagellar motor protein MotB
MEADHLRQYRVAGLLVGAAVFAALLIFVRADTASGRAAATLHVCPSGADYTTIGSAVAAANASDRIVVCPGTFSEQLVIDKSVTLVGAGPKQTKIRAPATLGGTQDIVEIRGSDVNVELSGFTIAGPGPCDGLLSGIFVRDDARASIHDNDIIALRNDPLGGCQLGVGVRVGRAVDPIMTSGTATIADNVISDYQKAGIFVDGEGSQATVTGNTVTGHGPTDVIAQNGIEVVRGASATVTGNTVSANWYLGENEGTGILLYGGLGDTTISRNTVTDSQFGIEAFSTGPTAGSRVTISQNTIRGGDRGISVGGDKDNPTKGLLIEENTIEGASTLALNADSDTSGNAFHRNDASATDGTGHFDCRDKSTGTATANTANTWNANTGTTSLPTSICSPPPVTIDTPPVIVLPPSSGATPPSTTQPPSEEQPPSGGQPPQPPGGGQPPSTKPPPQAGKPQQPAPPAEREAVTVANEIIARMKDKMLKSCAITLYGRGPQKALLARGLGLAPPGGRGRLLVRVGLLPRGEKVLSNLIGGTVVDVRAVCRSTSNEIGEKVKTARAVLQLEHAITPPGSWVPDKAILTPVGQRFLKSLAKRMVAATRIRCDGHTAAWAPSPVDAKALSSARARLVCGKLKRRGVAVEIRLIPHGNASPIATNNTEAGRAANRRVGITIVHPITVRTTRGKH